jgi:hypothetical protein
VIEIQAKIKILKKKISVFYLWAPRHSAYRLPAYRQSEKYTQHNDDNYNYKLHEKRGVAMLSVIMLCCVWLKVCVESHYAECRYAESRYADCRYADCHYAECRYAECHYAECRYAERRYAKCTGNII